MNSDDSDESHVFFRPVDVWYRSYICYFLYVWLILVVCLYVSMFVCVFVGVHVFVCMAFLHRFVNSIDLCASGNFRKTHLWDMEKHQLKKCGDWGFSSQLGGKSLSFSDHQNLRNCRRFNLLDWQDIYSKVRQVKTMVIWAPRRIKKPEKKQSKNVIGETEDLWRSVDLWKDIHIRVSPKIVALRAKLEKHRCVFFLSLFGSTDISWIYDPMISNESLPFAKVCKVCLLCLFVRASHIPWDLGMYQPCNLMKYYDVEAESGVRLYKFVFYMQLQHLTKGLG